MKVGQNIRKIRELKGYSQEYVAGAMDISQRNYSRIEKNEIELNLSKLSKISEILEVSPQQILGFDEKFFFSNCKNAYGATNQTNYAYSEKEREQYENQINHLKGEVLFLRNQLELFHNTGKTNE
tara:strand:- start:2701 stop:3075 length:375 start_codon:yes stop_codon:yes gene_type:complete